MNDSSSKTWLQYEAGKDYKRRIGLYATVRQNERFYRGDQWYMMESGGLPRPVFNIVKRVADYLICSVVPESVGISYRSDGAIYEKGNNASRVASLLSANAKYRWERSKMDSKLYKLAMDAVISGDGVLYSYWKGDALGDGVYEGDIETELIDNVNLFVSDVNKSDIQSQDYIILAGRASVLSLRREARANGISEKEISKIVPDRLDDSERSGDHASIELEGDDEAKATYLIKFWREEGKVCFEKSTRNCVINRVKTPCTLYPVAYFNWHPTKNSFHGTSAVEGMIANQKYVNRAYAMVMKHMGDTAFSKVIYDKSKIPEWSNEVGEAIAAIGGTNVSDAVAVLGVGKLADGYLDFLTNVISTAKEVNGATETALGNVTPENTSAILAVQEASKIPLKLVRAAFYRCIEDLAAVWADMTLAYFSSDRLVPMMSGSGELTSEKLLINEDEKMHFKAFIDVTDTSVFTPSITLSILDKLLDGGHITLQQYLERLPEGYISDKSALMGGGMHGGA